MSRNFELIVRAVDDQERQLRGNEVGMSPDTRLSQATEHDLPAIAREVLLAPSLGLVSRRGQLAYSLEQGVSEWPELPPDEEILPLVQKVFLNADLRLRPQTVLFSSVERAEGSPAVCVRVARTLAALGRGDVCLVDADLRAPSLHDTFDVAREPGFVDAVERRLPPHLQAREVSRGLWLVASGRDDSDTRALVMAESVRWLVHDLKRAFRWVLINTGRPEPGQAASVLGPLVDGGILVVSANETRRESAQQAKARLVAGGCRLIGTVLTDRTYPIPESIYRWI
jgi:Mrp family chromosome partitioning ATPase